MTRYQVDSDHVLSTTAGVHGSTDRIQAEAAGLYSQLVALQSSWTGSAASAFQAIAADWKATQQRVEESIANINTALAQAGRQYAETEATNARLFAA